MSCRIVLSLFAVLGWLFVGLMPVQAGQAVATGVAFKGNAQATRVSIAVSQELGYNARVLPDPYRIILDLADVSFDIPAGQGRKGKGLVKSLRYGIIEEGKSRIVIDTAGPVLIESSFLKPADGKTPAEIVIDLMAISEEVFMAAYAKDNPGAVPKPKPETTVAVADPVVVAAPMPKPRLKPVKQATPLQVIAKPKRSDGKQVIVIDAGHGGIDPGAISPNKTKEKDVVLAFAQTLKRAIDKGGKRVALLTRDSDTFMTLKDRVRFAREQGADLFIAIHADIVRGKTATGTTLYTLSETASDEEAAALAQKENRADMIAGIDLEQDNQDVTDILIDLIQRESKNHAVAASRSLLKELKPVTPMAGKPLRSAGFTVLKAPDIPSVLVELGFLSTKIDEERLNSVVWRDNTARAMAVAIERHFESQVAIRQ